MMRARRLTLTVLATLGALTGSALASSAPALAVEAVGLGSTFGSATSTQPDPEPLSSPAGVAENQGTKDIYVVDKGNNRVEYFTSTGVYIGQFDGSGANLPVEGTAAPTGKFSSPEDIAVDNDPSSPSFEDVYVVDTGHNVIDKFSKTGHYESQLTGTCASAGTCPGSVIPFGGLDGVAVDSSGKVWVYQESKEIDDFSDALVNEFLAFRSSAAFGGASPGFAVDSEENLYVGSAFGVAKLNVMGEVLEEEVGGLGERPGGISVDPSSNNVYIDTGTSVTVVSPGGVESFGSGPLNGSTGIAVDTASGRVYVAEQAHNEVDIFERGSTPPAPNTNPATAVTNTSATLHGDLHPGGVTGGVGYYFSYNIGASCTGPGSITTPFDNGGANATGNSDVSESASVTELQPNAHYAFCLVADKFGSTAGPALTFTTTGAPPTVDREAAQTTTLEAELTAFVNPNNQDTNQCQFQYVDAPHYNAAASDPYGAGGTAPCTPPDLGAGFGEASTHAEISGLSPSTTYDFRVVVTNAAGTTDGADTTFETKPSVPPSVEGESATVFAPPGVTLEAQVNPEFANTTYYFQYGTTTSYASGSTPAPPGENPGASITDREREGVGVNVMGLAGSTTYHYRVVATNPAGTTYGTDQTFTTPPPPPAVSTGAASAITKSDATLTGTVNPETLATSYSYQYGLSTEYGQSAPAYPGIGIGAGSSAEPAPFTLTALTPGTTYHYRLVATNEDGTSYGQDETFTTVADQPPIVSTGAASGISTSGATISGTVDPQEVQATYEFEYGTDTGYGTQVSGTAYPEQGEQTVTLSLQGLQPDTTYHYRLVASNANTSATGEDATFTTPGILDPLVFPATAPPIAGGSSIGPALTFPAGSQANTGTTTKTLTKAEKLKKAVKACGRKPRKKRAGCERRVRKKFKKKK